MQFDTPAEYRKHLRSLGMDNTLVEQCVRAKFPVQIGSRELDAMGRKRPKQADEDYYARTDRQNEESLERANKRFVEELFPAKINFLLSYYGRDAVLELLQSRRTA